jgi:hypothetical protein
MNDVMTAFFKDEAIRMIDSMKEESILATGIDLAHWDVIVINTSGWQGLAGDDGLHLSRSPTPRASSTASWPFTLTSGASSGRAPASWPKSSALTTASTFHRRSAARRATCSQQIEAARYVPGQQEPLLHQRPEARSNRQGSFTQIVKPKSNLGRQVRILNCMGLRAEESAMRAKKPGMVIDDAQLSNAKREVTTLAPDPRTG